MQLSSTVYWYQAEPHAPLPAVPHAGERAPAPEQSFWPEKETLPSVDALRQRTVKLHMLCGRPEKEVIFAEPAYSAKATKGYAWNGWGLPVYHARAGNDEVEIELTVPKGAQGRQRGHLHRRMGRGRPVVPGQSPAVLLWSLCLITLFACPGLRTAV